MSFNLLWNSEIMKTPTSIPEFNKEWLKFILEDWFNRKSNNNNDVEILEFKANKNSLQVFNQNLTLNF